MNHQHFYGLLKCVWLVIVRERIPRKTMTRVALAHKLLLFLWLLQICQAPFPSDNRLDRALSHQNALGT